MSTKFKEMTGKTVNGIEFLYRVESRHGKTYYKCKCHCGNEFENSSSWIRRGLVKSCGCLKKSGNFNRKHGLSSHQLYSTYMNMLSRCYNEKRNCYPDYGGRGIRVCDRWKNGEDNKHGFECFIEDMGERPQKHTLDRRNPNKDYCPTNCRWSNSKTQNNNNRSHQKLKDEINKLKKEKTKLIMTIIKQSNILREKS